MGNHKVLRSAGNNLRYSMYEFIEAVHKRSIIWERKHPNFHNRELRDQAWQQIGQELCSNFAASSEPEKQEIVKTLLKRWKNTRDSYLRVNRLRQSGEEAARASYIYEKELSFLLDVKAETEDEEEPLKEDPKPQAKRKRLCAVQRTAKTPKRRNFGQETTPEPALDSPTIQDSLQSVLGDLTYTREDTAPPEIVSLPQCVDPPCSTNTAPASVTADPDQAFFDTIKPHMQRMCPDRKLDFQIEVLKILRNFKPN
ncbi:uncharacterized protein LOC108099392 [Drosophila ficusphila]|uniref:uncharacterized protein LOC108099392 n=1 Tax=Drosophila ficusphila TaxID=30025 RepID=UPI0007E5F731|nr:uncharacterized protein LOC108099392 [Drosophila ficusphila]